MCRHVVRALLSTLHLLASWSACPLGQTNGQYRHFAALVCGAFGCRPLLCHRCHWKLSLLAFRRTHGYALILIQSHEPCFCASRQVYIPYHFGQLLDLQLVRSRIRSRTRMTTLAAPHLTNTVVPRISLHTTYHIA